MAKKKTVAGQMRAPQMEKLGEESGTREGYGATPEDEADPRKPIKIDPGPKPEMGKMGNKVKQGIESDAKKKNRKKY